MRLSSITGSYLIQQESYQAGLNIISGSELIIKATRLESDKKSAIAKIMSHKITKTCKPLSDQCVKRMDEPLIERLFNV